jgi:hypothetical protein
MNTELKIESLRAKPWQPASESCFPYSTLRCMPAPKLLALADVMRLYLDDALPRGPTYWFAAAAAVAGAGCASFVAPFLGPLVLASQGRGRALRCCCRRGGGHDLGRHVVQGSRTGRRQVQVADETMVHPVVLLVLHRHAGRAQQACILLAIATQRVALRHHEDRRRELRET